MNQELPRGFKRETNGNISFTIESLEIALLTSMIEQIISILKPLESEKQLDPLAKIIGIDSQATKPDDEVILRLLPDAYQDDVEAAHEFRRFTERSLRQLKIERAQFVLENLPEPDKTISIKSKDFDTWLTVLNDVRLALGTRIGVNSVDEELADEESEEGDHAHDIYSWLTWLQSNLLEEINF
jgi:hypothetical protein